MGDRVSHPHKTTDNIMDFYILILKFLDQKRKDK